MNHEPCRLALEDARREIEARRRSLMMLRQYSVPKAVVEQAITALEKFVREYVCDGEDLIEGTLAKLKAAVAKP